jgi:hypothetical protein
MQTHRILPFAKWLTVRFFKALVAIPIAVHTNIRDEVERHPALGWLFALMLGAIGALLGLLLAAFTDNLWWVLITASILASYMMYVMVMVQYEKFCDEKNDFWKKMKE